MMANWRQARGRFKNRLFAPEVTFGGRLREEAGALQVVALGPEAYEFGALYARCLFEPDSIEEFREQRFIPWAFLRLLFGWGGARAVRFFVLPGPWKQMIRRISQFEAPQFVWHRVALTDTWEAIIARMTSMRRSQVKQYLKKASYQIEFSRLDEDFSRFYDELYQPFVEQRHGNLARPMDRTVAYEHFQTCGLLTLRSGTVRVASALLRAEQDSVEISLIAVARDSDGQDLIKHAQLALYIESMKRAKDLGASWLDLSGTKPFVHDGLFAYKSSYGSTVSHMGSHIGRVQISLPSDKIAMAAVVSSAPFFVERSGVLELACADGSEWVTQHLGKVDGVRPAPLWQIESLNVLTAAGWLRRRLSGCDVRS